MKRFRIVQVAPSYEPKSFRVDEYNGLNVLKEDSWVTAKDENGWAFFNSEESADTFIQNKILQKDKELSSDIFREKIIKQY